VLEQTANFTRYLFAYPSDGLRITGMLNRPKGAGPFQVVILNHGYYPLDVYQTGNGSKLAADYLAARGFLTLAPDFRSHAGSDDAPNLFRAGHVIDTLNLIPLAPLASSTTYEVVFSGSVAGTAVSRRWRFTTAAWVAPTLTFASPTVPPGGTQRATLTGLDLDKGNYYVCHGPPHLVTSLAFEGEATFVLRTSSDCAAGRSCEVVVATSYHSSCASPFAQGAFAIAP
jgi:hypothetical protein